MELSTSMDATDGVRSLNLPIRKEKSATYYLRLNKQPEASGWWVRVHVDGAVYIDGVLAEKGIWWVPSVGWEINKNGSGPTPWRSVTIYATEDSDADGEPVNVTHEVWDEHTNCPPSLHGIAPVTVRIIDSGDGGGDGNGDGNGDGVAAVVTGMVVAVATGMAAGTISPRGCRLTMRQRYAKANRRRSSCD